MPDETPMQTIEDRARALRFRIPAGWTVENDPQDPEEGGTYYDPAQEAVTLRVSLQTYDSPQAMTLADTGPFLRIAADEDEGLLEDLPGGQGLYVVRPWEDEEDGVPLVFCTWMVARILPPKKARLAVFTATILAEEAESDAVQATLHLIDREVRAAVLSEKP